MEDLKFHLTCPRLEKANLSFFLLDGLGTNIQWDNLTHLTLRCIFIEDSFLILRTTPRLVFCKVSADRRQHKSTGALVLSSLRDLQLPTRITSLSRLSEIEHITGVFLDNIIAPYLEEFSFPNYYTRSMRPMEAITSFLRRSACSLLSLSICFSNYRPYIETFTNLLQSIPSLNTLSLLSVTTPICHGYAYRDGYDPWNILQLVAKVLSSQTTRIFTKPQDFGIYRKA